MSIFQKTFVHKNVKMGNIGSLGFLQRNYMQIFSATIIYTFEIVYYGTN